MQIAFEIDIPSADEAALAQALGCASADLNDALNRHGKAALREYLECYLGRRAFTRGSDILEHRLALLIVEAFEGEIPTAAQVADLFQTTLSGGRTLVRNSFSKYRYQLDETAGAAARQVLEAVTWQNGSCYAQITAPNLVELMNRRLLSADPTLREVARVQGVVGTFLIDRDAYAQLCGLFGANPVSQPQP